jgi:ELWxxDGT repeat protein
MAVGSSLYLVGGDSDYSLWKYDGATFTEIKSGTITPHEVSDLTAVGATLYFTGLDDAGYQELWKYDGTTLNEIKIGSSYYAGPSDLTAVGSTLYFTAFDGRAGRLWKYDGTTLTEVKGGAANYFSPSDLTAVGNTLYFTAYDGTGDQLWKYDGSAAPPAEIKAGAAPDPETGQLTAVWNTLYFTANDGTGSKLWKYDGSNAAPAEEPINPSGDSRAGGLSAIGNTLYLSANDGSHGVEPWIDQYDGNQDGIPDNQQPNVSSLQAATPGVPQYVTLASSSGTILTNAVATKSPSTTQPPPDAAFPVGYLDFTVGGLTQGAATAVQLYLPPGVTANAYYQYGPTPDNSSPHWYSFSYDSLTNTGATFGTAPDGRELITLHYVDGQRGDGDLSGNGQITDPGAPGILPTIQWVNPAGGDWDTASNWLDSNGVARVPGPNDVVAIGLPGQNTFTVTHSTGADSVYSLSSQDALVLSGGSLSIAAGSTVNNSFTLSGGTLGGPGSLTVNGGSTLSGGTLDGANLVIARCQTAVLTGLQVVHGAVVENDGTVTVAVDGAVLGGDSSSAFDNLGTFRKTAGAAPWSSPDAYAQVNLPFDNQGTVEVRQGALRLVGPSASAPFASSGALRVDAGALVDVHGWATFAAGSQTTGDNVAFDFATAGFAPGSTYQANETGMYDSTVTVAGTVTGLGGVWVQSSTLDVSAAEQGPAGATLANLLLSGGTLVASQAWEVAGSFDGAGGTLTGGGRLTADGGPTPASGMAAQVTSGLPAPDGTALDGLTLDDFTLAVPQGAAANWTGSLQLLHGAVLDNYGTITETSSDTIVGGDGTGSLYEEVGAVSGSQYGQIIVPASVRLGGTLHVRLASGFTPQVGASFALIINQGTNPVSGTFAGLPDGATFTASGNQFQISYAGGTDHQDVTLTVTKVATTTAVTSSADPSDFGQAVTITATVSAGSIGSDVPTGTVTFYDGSTALGTGTLSTTAGVTTATLTTSSLGTGSHSITAAYAGNTNFTGSTSAALTQTVDAAATTTVVSSSANAPAYGQEVTFTATVTNASSGLAPTGAVEFFDTTTNTDLGAGTFGGSNGNSSAWTFSSSALTAGSHTIEAVFSGSPGFDVGSRTLAQAINPAALAVTVGNQGMTYGGSVPAFTYSYTGLVNDDTSAPFTGALTTTATATSGVGGYAITQGTLAATGNYTLGSFTPGTLTVTPYAFPYQIGNDSQTYGSPANLAADLGTVVTTGVNGETLTIAYGSPGDTATANAGPYPITGVISDGSGLATNYTVTLSDGTLTVNKADQTIAFGALGGSTYGDPDFALGATASSGLAVTYTATANAQVYQNAQGTWMVHITGAGSATITAHQAGDANHNPAADVSQTLSIAQAAPTFSAVGTTVITVATPSVTLSGTISYGSLVPTGSVTVTVDGVSQAAAIGAGGRFSATFPTGSLNVGTHNVTFSYGGDPNFTAASASGSLDDTYGVLALFDQTKKHSGSVLHIQIALATTSRQDVSSGGVAVTAQGFAATTDTTDTAGTTDPSNVGALTPAQANGGPNATNAFQFQGGAQPSYGYDLKIPKGLAAGTYRLYFSVAGDPLWHWVAFTVG